MINRKLLFDAVRGPLFGGALRPLQTAGLTAMLDRWEALPEPRDDRRLAYMLATAHHETGRTMQPIRERGGAAYLSRMYDIAGERPALARRMGNTRPGDGVRYCGRGYVQLTWRSNYRKAGEKLGRDLEQQPDLAMDAAVAADIMFAGMAEGWFTGKRLADFFSQTREDWRGARRIINGLDRADLIKGYALEYRAALAHASDARAPQRKAASARRSAASSSKAQGPSATNSTPVAASGFTASGPGA
jgi:putative chitinase